MPVGNLANAKPADRSHLSSMPAADPVEQLREAVSTTFDLDKLSPAVLVTLLGAEYMLALHFSRLYNPMWWSDGIRALQPEAHSVFAVSRGPGENVSPGAGASGDGVRDDADQPGRAGTLESQRRQPNQLSSVAVEPQDELSHIDSVGGNDV